MKLAILVVVIAFMSTLAGRLLPMAADDPHTFENENYAVVVEDDVASLAAKNSKIRIEFDDKSWSGGVSVNYLVEPTGVRKMSWCTDLNADGSFDLRGSYSPSEKTTVLEIYSKGGWVTIKSIDKTKRVALAVKGTTFIWETEGGWRGQ